MTTPGKVTATFWDHCAIHAADPSLAGHSTDGGRVSGITRRRYAECEQYGCQPVAIVPFQDRVQVERLRDLWDRAWVDQDNGLLQARTRGARASSLQAALREYADLTPPKPEEPTGLGAAVEDAEGVQYVRVPVGDSRWVRSGPDVGRRLYEYDDIDVVRVLSEGVTEDGAR